jgi:hypothetical protein
MNDYKPAAATAALDTIAAIFKWIWKLIIKLYKKLKS